MYLRIDEHESEKIAVIEDTGKQYTYNDIIAFVDYFKKLIPKRSLIFILCRNTFAAIAAHIACVENEVVALLVNEKMNSSLLYALVDAYEPEYMWFPDGHNERNYRVISSCYGYTLVATGYNSPSMNDELAMLLTTSGSTGSPKLVRHSYQNLYSNAKNVAGVFGFNSNDRAWIDLQINYTMGLNVACTNLYAGGSIALSTRNIPEAEYWNFFNHAGITNICGVPFSYEMLRKMKFFKRNHEGLRIIAEGGGRLTDELFSEIADYALKNNVKFYATFGTSETTSRLAYLPPEAAVDKIGSIGKAIPGGKVYLTDSEGLMLPETDMEGELAYEGPNVTLGYAYCKDDLRLGDEFKGVYHTGDMACRDADGYFYIIGRKSRFLKMFGIRVSLDETERIIKDHFHIECACAGIDDKMALYITPESHNISDDIKHYISSMLKIQISGFEVIVIDAIPKNESGKTIYSALKH